MNWEEIREDVRKLMSLFSKSFINRNLELIIEPKNNIYFRLEDVKTKRDLDFKVIAFLSRPCIKGVSNYYQKIFRKRVNEYLGTNFSFEEFELIYTYLGNGCHHPLCVEFVDSGFDISLLKTYEKNNN